MLSSITPLGERGHGRRWGATVAWYMAGSVAGGAAFATLLGLGAQALPRPGATTALALVAALLALAVAADAGVVPLPTVRRQVNEDWLRRYRSWVIGVGFGAQLGAGVVTIVTTATVYLTFALGALTGSWLAAASVGATFGLARAAPALALGGVTSPERLAAVHRRMARWAPRAHRAALACSALLALGAVRPW